MADETGSNNGAHYYGKRRAWGGHDKHKCQARQPHYKTPGTVTEPHRADKPVTLAQPPAYRAGKENTMPATIRLIPPSITKTEITTAPSGYTYLNTTNAEVWVKQSSKQWKCCSIINGKTKTATRTELIGGGHDVGVRVYDGRSGAEYPFLTLPEYETNGTVAINDAGRHIIKAHNGQWYDIGTGESLDHEYVQHKGFRAVAVIR